MQLPIKDAATGSNLGHGEVEAARPYISRVGNKNTPRGSSYATTTLHLTICTGEFPLSKNVALGISNDFGVKWVNLGLRWLRGKLGPIHVPLNRDRSTFCQAHDVLVHFAGKAVHSRSTSTYYCIYIYDTRLVYGTLLEFRMDSMGDHIVTLKPDTKNLQVFLVVRARARDNLYAESNKPNKPINASFLLNNVHSLYTQPVARRAKRLLSGSF
ncbi:hypothetical protein HD806DRAFT_527845 [Xylariaceae sp. AK1471]|nr:hypothetical protein HD806DRAFT_527845 [Xylariaceae sp. AK1471]